MRVVIALGLLVGTLVAGGRSAGGPPGPAPGAPLLRRIPVPDPAAFAIDEQAGRAFVAGGGPVTAGYVATLDARDGRLLRRAQVGIESYTLALDPFTGRVFVGNYTSGTVSVLDARSGALLRAIPVGGSPGLMVADIATGRIFVLIANAERGSGGPSPSGGWVGVLDARTGDVLRRAPFPRGRQLTAIAADVAGGRIFVIAYSLRPAEGADLVTLDARTGDVLRTIHNLGPQPTANVLAVDGRAARVFLIAGSGVQVFDAANGALVRTVDFGDVEVDGLFVDPRVGRVVVPLRKPMETRTPHGVLAVLDARSGRVLRVFDVATPVAAVAPSLTRTGQALVLLSSPASIDVRTSTTTVLGPGALAQLDATTGALRHKVAAPDAVGYGGAGVANGVGFSRSLDDTG